MNAAKHSRRLAIKSQQRNRRGATLVLAVALMFVLFSTLALTVDVGYLASSKAELDRTADAAALAGCWELYGQMENGIEGEAAYASVRTQAAAMAALNPVCQLDPNVDASNQTNEISIGYVGSYADQAISSDSSLPFFAVRVNVHKNSQRNGEVPYFFGRIFGDTGREASAQATAVMSRRISGFAIPASSSLTCNVLPFALDVGTWDAMMVGTTTVDNFAFDASSNSVIRGHDGKREVNLYPQGTGSPGNRGTVDIGGANNSTNDIARQIVHGISRADLIELDKPLNISSPTGTLELNGDTGISAGVKDELASIIGEKRIIPLFKSVSGNGNNATYVIERWVGVRILDVKLTGKMSGKKLIIQPAPVISPCAIVSTSSAHTSDYVLTPVTLAQ